MKLGKFIAEGVSRKVYEHPTDPTKVIKVLKKGMKVHNSREFSVWNALKNTKYRTSLAPCYTLSRCTRYLVMARAERVTRADEPIQRPPLPDGFTDVQCNANIGRINGKVVVIDYANAKVFLRNQAR